VGLGSAPPRPARRSEVTIFIFDFGAHFVWHFVLTTKRSGDLSIDRPDVTACSSGATFVCFFRCHMVMCRIGSYIHQPTSDWGYCTCTSPPSMSGAVAVAYFDSGTQKKLSRRLISCFLWQVAELTHGRCGSNPLA
jgi:hypothetical protein